MIKIAPFHQTEDNGITYIHTEFQISTVTYMAIFSNDLDTLHYFQEDNEIKQILENKHVYSIKFAVKDYIESETDDLYAPPFNHQFGKKEITLLKQTLEQLIQEHYLQFKPHCYVFTAERPSLAKMYRKMCSERNKVMLDFEPIIDLGSYQDCFILKTPTYLGEIE